MKGITPVVAIILLLLITISMVGFAFVWFTRVAELTTKQTEEQLQAQLSAMSQKIRIDAINSTTVTVRNIGSQEINSANVGFFFNGGAVTCTPASWTGTLTVGSTKTCSYPNTVTCTSGVTVKVVAPGNSDAANC